MRIVHVANFYGPRSGGIRTAMHALARQYRQHGHEPMLVVPGTEDGVTWHDGVPVLTVRAPRIPGLGGYRVVTRPAAVRRLLERIAPDRLEVSDRTTLTGLGDWARAAGVPSVLWLHERVDGVLRAVGPGWGTARVTPPVGAGLHAVADTHNARTLPRFDHLVATTAFAAGEAERLAARRAAHTGSGGIPGHPRTLMPPLHRVALGVDLDTFTPDRFRTATRAELAPDGEALVLVVSRLSREKRVDLAVDAVAALRASGRPARLVVAGAGPLAATLQDRARRRAVPAAFLSFVPDRARLATLLASADVVVAPGPVETFGLAALEALASGTPVVVSATSALPEVVGDAGAVAAPTPGALAAAMSDVLDRARGPRRAAARERAEQFPWSAAGQAMLAVHGVPVAAGHAAAGHAADGHAAAGQTADGHAAGQVPGVHGSHARAGHGLALTGARQ
ncbi:glycosyltransferase [Xylanimonas allomyrinae]|uniref:D-inositol 3-phosphate glycosyltransferase n=1 Tax=Xylanimonas allomyrinae TaxID=2509459 RepID=A0A4P6ENA4_9MICO|nr:glycosyltransferase [Xylanimonas allomyrinae]QAY64184.1 glycosyltransferase [Xylanimonas allomyrinae]